MHLIGVHQELGAIVINRQTDMVRHPFVHVQPCRPAECGGHIYSLCPVGHILWMAVHDGSLDLPVVRAIDDATTLLKEVSK